MKCSITWAAWCELWLRRRLHGRKTCSPLWSQLDRSCWNTTPKELQWQACITFLHISSILFGSWDHLEAGTREWILILRTRHPILPNTKRPCWIMWRMNTAPNIDLCRTRCTKAFRAAISSTLHRLQDPVTHPLIRMICSVMTKDTWRLTMWVRWHPDEAIAQHVYW